MLIYTTTTSTTTTAAAAGLHRWGKIILLGSRCTTRYLGIQEGKTVLLGCGGGVAPCHCLSGIWNEMGEAR